MFLLTMFSLVIIFVLVIFTCVHRWTQVSIITGLLA
jgi:hypothetical protein